MSNQAGTLGKYQIIREIARSNDIVYEAYDPLMNRRVALKELAMPPGATPQQRDERIKRFLREARAAGTLAHPNIMTVYEAGEADGRHYIAMEYLDGHTLRSELDTRGFLPLEKTYEIAEKVLLALEFAHKQGVIHRDIKPENIQLLSDGRIKLTDFGIARLTFEPNLTMDGQVFGTPSYMSPEQVVGKEIDARSDLFSMGVVVYEMASGQKPFTGDSVVSITYAIMNKEPDRPAQINFALWQVLQRALDKSPQLRYPSAKDMDAALKGADQAARQGPVIDPQPNAGVNRPHLQQPVNPATGQPQRTPYQQGYFYTPSAQPQPKPQPQQPQAIYGNLPAQPINAPYNPYQPAPQAPSAAPPVIPGAPYAGQQIPIYYPPPPRPPLMKPETKAFMGRLVLTLVLIGTLLALLLVFVNAISTVFQRSQLQSEDAAIVNLINSQDPKKPLEVRIKERREKYIPQLQSKENVEEQNRQLAVLYQELARRQNNQGNRVEAEASLVQARDLDPENAAYLSSLGKLFADQADRAGDLDMKISLYERSAGNWKEAAERETDSEKARTYNEGAAQAMYKQAEALSSKGMKHKSLELLYDARRLTQPGSRTQVYIDQLLEVLGRSE